MSSVEPSQTYSRGTDGCVVCPTAPACPECAEDENCVLTALTCNTCPYTYCAKKSSSSISILSSVDANGNAVNSTNSTSTSKSSGSHVDVGGLVSGVVVGSVLAFVLLLVLYYWRRHKRVNALQSFNMGKNDSENGVIKWDSNVDSDNDDDLDDDDLDDDDLDDLDEEDLDNHHPVPQPRYERHPPLEDIIEEGDDDENDGAHNNVTFKKPHKVIEQFRLKPMRPLKAASDTQSIYSNNTVHTKASSNILPIAYIPGVTITQGRTTHGRSNMNQDDIRSHITLGSSILGSEDNFDLESLPIQMMQPSMNSASQTSLTTAIRAKPKLVTINREDEENEQVQKTVTNEEVPGTNGEAPGTEAQAGTHEVPGTEVQETQEVQGTQDENESTDLSDNDSFTVDLDISIEDPFNDRHEISS